MKLQETEISDASISIILLLKTKNHRLHSWEHCFNFFNGLSENAKKNEIDNMALNLAFYLASFGMYRGKAKLLGYDYKILIPIVRHLLKNRPKNYSYKSLDLLLISDSILNMFECINLLKVVICNNISGQIHLRTLSTKILLGTYGNTVAFDGFLVSTINKYGESIKYDSKESFFRAYQFIEKHYQCFERQIINFKRAGFIGYPPLRIVDLILWKIGEGIAIDDKKAKMHSRMLKIKA